jgi:DNA-binding response OmpR family regulator
MTTPNIEYAHLVLVEDDQGLSQLIHEYFSLQGYRVTRISDGNEAIKQIPELLPECVILDIMLPGVDGIEVCRQVREHYHGPIIFLTAKGEQLDEILGLEVGGDDYLTKPVEPRRLLAHVRAHLRRQQQYVKSGDLRAPTRMTLDTKKEAAIYGDESISLSQAEFSFIHLIMSRAGDIVSRDEIMMETRGVEHDGVSRAVDILVSELRKKLPDPEWIKTVRGKGYSWHG